MKTLKDIIAILLCFALCAPLAMAQPVLDKQQEAQATKQTSQDVQIIIQQEQVRFTARKEIVEMQLQVFDQWGRLVYDSGSVMQPELNWTLRQAGGEAVKSGMYAYTLSIREAGAETARVRRGHFIVDRAKERDGRTDRLWITSQNENGVGTELTVARSEGETIAGANLPGERKGTQVEGEAALDGESGWKNEGKDSLAAAVSGTTGQIAKFISPTDLGNSVMSEVNGKVGIGTSAPAAKMEIFGNWTGEDGALRLSGDKPTIRFTGGPITGNQSWILHLGSDGPGNLQFFRRTGANAWNPVMSLTPEGNVGIGTSGTGAKLAVYNNDLGIVSRVTGGFAAIFGDTSYSNGVGGLFRNTSGGVALRVIGITETGTLRIIGGADFAENFEINSEKANNETSAAKIEAGMVVSIDPASPGQLQLSARAYDRRVAGVISGAGGVKPGMVMNQEGTMADGKQPVALSGRVYCWVDASRGAIEPGDLLTTSNTPGHAMKASDSKKAQGAIIGKAMTGLKSGKGLVLVLVTLQ